MKLKTIFNFLIFAAFLLTSSSFFSCSSPTGPGGDTPGRRDYVWTVDTLNSPMNVLNSIWGSSPTNVWTIGPGGDANNRLFHYDGLKWTKAKGSISCTGKSLIGFNSDDIWMGGENGQIWHYDGTLWKADYEYKPINTTNVYIGDIWGTNHSDIYAVGVITNGSDETQRGFILHYDGIKWQELYRADFYSQFQRIRKENDEIYVQAIKAGYTVSDTSEFYELVGDNLTKIYSESNEKIYTANLNMIGDKVYFTIGRDVYRYEATILGLKKFVKKLSFDDPNFGYQVYGRGEKDLFVRMVNGLAHYNGTDLVYMQTFNNNFTSINNTPVIFDNEVFFCGKDFINNINFVLRGKLK
jgi:hypothetical protein